MAALLAGGAGGVLVVAIMVIGSLGLWIATPLLWVWVGSQVQGATDSVGAAFGVGLAGAVATMIVVARLLTALSNGYRATRRARGLEDLGHAVLEHVLVISAGIALAVFAAWFLFFAGANPIPTSIAV